MGQRPQMEAASKNLDGLIEFVVHDPDDLFDRLDPSISTVRHLAEHVEDFILHKAKSIRASRYRLVMRTSTAAMNQEEGAAFRDRIKQFFHHRADEERDRMHRLIRDGIRDLVIGLAFLFVCAAVALTSAKVLRAPVGLFVEQGLLILGWVALWRPADLLLYEVRPVRVRRDLLTKLSQATVTIAAI